MQIEIHAGRFEDDDEARAKRVPYYSNPAIIDIKPDEAVAIWAKDGVVHVTINGESQMPISLGEWDYTALALTYR